MENPFQCDKLLRFPRHIADWMDNGTTRGPVGLDLDLTNKCPHDCPRCPGEWKQSPGAQLTKWEAIDYLKQFRDVGALAVNFAGGGDPLAHPQAGDVIRAASEMGFSVGVMTNGSRLDGPESFTWGCSWIRISLDADTPERYEMVHGVPGSEFERVSENIRRLSRLEGRCVLGVSMLTEAANRHAIMAMARYAKDLTVDYVQFRPFNHDQTDVREEINDAANELDSDTFKVRWATQKYELMNHGYVKPYAECHAHNFWTIVNADAYVQLCCDCREPAYRLGNLRDQTLQEIWYGKQRQEVCQAIDVRQCVPLCRFNQHNLVLDNLTKPILHCAHL